MPYSACLVPHKNAANDPHDSIPDNPNSFSDNCPRVGDSRLGPKTAVRRLAQTSPLKAGDGRPEPETAVRRWGTIVLSREMAVRSRKTVVREWE
jgi:hypothetical protein